MTRELKKITETVRRLGGSIRRIDKLLTNTFEIRYKNKVGIFAGGFTIGETSIRHVSFTTDKGITNFLLKKEQIKQPKTVVIKKGEKTTEIKKCLKKLNLPLIIKSAKGSHCKNIFFNVKTQKDSLQKIKKLFKKVDKLLVQEIKKGREYRVLVLDKKIIGVVSKDPTFIVGDGKNNLEYLIKQKNKQENRKKNPIKQTLALNKLLRKQKVNLETVPENNQIIYLEEAIFYGDRTADRLDFTADIHPEMAKICIEASKAVGCKLSGIDIICQDITKKNALENYAIIEVNSRPNLFIHYYPYTTRLNNQKGGIDVMEKIIKHIFNEEI